MASLGLQSPMCTPLNFRNGGYRICTSLFFERNPTSSTPPMRLTHAFGHDGLIPKPSHCCSKRSRGVWFMDHLGLRTLIHLAWKMANARKDIQNHLLNLRPWMNMVFQSTFAQMMVAHICLEVSVWTTDGSFLSVHFFLQHLTVTSMLNVLHPLDLSNTSSNIFRKVQILHPLKSTSEMKLRGTRKVVISVLQKQGTVSINSTFMDKCRALFVFKSTYQVNTWSPSIPVRTLTQFLLEHLKNVQHSLLISKLMQTLVN